jgi:crotonobetainyl-CoA:carnitine CoA-transferase CaiB-like acyl-CoA transferase
MHPVKYDGETPAVRLAPQLLGAQTREILGELGYGEDQIRDFEAKDVVRSHGTD